jgi:N-acetylgalactosamine-6-sulfatase
VGFARNPVTIEGLAKGHNTVARALADVGYDTTFFGKWHLGAESNSSPRAQGFSEFLGFYPWTISYYSHQTVTEEPGFYDDYGPVSRDGYLTDLLSDEACAFINRERAAP